MKNYLLVAILTISSIVISPKAQEVDTIRVGDVFKNHHLLKEQTIDYLVHSEFKGFVRLGVLIRSSVKKIEHQGEDYISVEHDYYGPDKKTSGDFYSIVEPETFKPIIHIRNIGERGKEAYRFTEKALVALDTVKDNSEKGYNLDLEKPIFNFELDLTTFSMLPMREGYRAVLRFHHPGSKTTKPDWYEIKVEGSEKIEIPGEKEVDTWILFMDYNGTQPTRFWYTKEGQEFVKMEGNYNGVKIYKTRLF
ncbi:MAG: hypothetical protein BalsKO_27580 [Balneolaceae bacterium]